MTNLKGALLVGCLTLFAGAAQAECDMGDPNCFPVRSEVKAELALNAGSESFFPCDMGDPACFPVQSEAKAEVTSNAGSESFFPCDMGDPLCFPVRTDENV